MTASQVIDEIVALPPGEQAKVIRFAAHLESRPQLTGDELAALAQRLADAADVAEASVLRDEIVRGFYGQAPHA